MPLQQRQGLLVTPFAVEHQGRVLTDIDGTS
jgi:hypothetical protein